MRLLQTLLVISVAVAFLFYGGTILLNHLERTAASRSASLEDAELDIQRRQSRHMQELESVKQACEESKQTIATNYKAICESRERKLLSQIQDAKEEVKSVALSAKRAKENPTFGDLSASSLHVQKALLSLAKEVSYHSTTSKNAPQKKTSPETAHQLFIAQTATNPSFFMSTLNPSNDKYIAPSLHKRGTWESHIVGLMEEVIGDNCLPGKFKGKNPPLVVDVGANHGFFGLFGAAKGCRAALVEPQPELVHHIYLSVAMNPKFTQRVRIYDNIVNDQEHAKSTLFISMKDSNVGGRKVVNASSCKDASSCVPVSSITIDEITGDLSGNPENVIFMKIDCEGFEPFAIRSAPRLFKRLPAQQVPYIAMELYLPSMKGGTAAAKEIMHTLYDAGYFMQPIKGRSKKGWVRRENLDAFVDKWGNSFGDVYFVHKNAFAAHNLILEKKEKSRPAVKSKTNK